MEDQEVAILAETRSFSLSHFPDHTPCLSCTDMIFGVNIQLEDLPEQGRSFAVADAVPDPVIEDGDPGSQYFQKFGHPGQGQGRNRTGISDVLAEVGFVDTVVAVAQDYRGRPRSRREQC